MTDDERTRFRAIFGDAGGAHNLVSAGKAAPSTALSELASRYTDRLLPPDSGWKPYICGFPLEGFYVVSRTFAVRASRAGMVQTHAILIPLGAAGNEWQLDELLNLLPESPLTPPFPDLDAVTARPPVGGALLPPETPTPRGYPSVVRALFNGRRPVWIGQERFDEVITLLWRRLWPEARREFRFRVAAEPAELECFPATIVCSLPAFSVNWNQDEIVDREATTLTAPTRAESLLLGLPNGIAIAEALSRLGVSIRTVADLERLESYLRMTEMETADGDRSAVRLLGKMAPDPLTAAEEKSTVLRNLARRTAEGPESGIIALRNINVAPFAGGEHVLRGAIDDWLLRCLARGDGGGSAFLAALSGETGWSAIVLAAVRQLLESWNARVAALLWRWWEFDANLVTPSLALIDRATEKTQEDLISAIPISVSSSLRGVLIDEFRIARWARLTAEVLTRCDDLRVIDRFEQQIQVDFDCGTHEGISVLARKVAAHELLEAAIALADPALLNLAGTASISHPEIMAACDPSRAQWRAVWAARLQVATDPFAGIPDPATVGHSLLDQLILGVTVPVQLQSAATTDPRADFEQYGRRAEVWPRLDPKVASKAEAVVANMWLERFEADRPGSTELEATLFPAIATHWRAGPSSISPTSICRFFTKFDSLLSEFDLTGWLLQNTRQFGFVEASALGHLVAEKRWLSAAHTLFKLWRTGKTDLVPALRECSASLGLWDRATFAWGSRTVAITEEEWWAAFLETSIDLYPRGVNQQNIWEDAGGDISRISKGSGREEWAEAIHLLRQGGAGKHITIPGLLHQMRRDFHYNQQLELLEGLFNRHFS